MITVVLAGEPQGKGRPRFRAVRTKSGANFVSAYTPAKTRDYERSLAWAAKAAIKGREPLGGSVKVTVQAFMGIPRSWPNRKRDAALAGTVRPGKPDVDNVLKTLDALNGIILRDDAQIVEAHIAKFYSENPRLIIEISELSHCFDVSHETA